MAGASYGVLSNRHGVCKSQIYKRAQKEGWPKQRERLVNAVETKTIEKTSDAIADNAAIAQDIKRKLLLRLKRIEEKYPLDATEVRTHSGNNTAIFRIRDLTAAYKDLVGDAPKSEMEIGVPQVIDDV